MPNESTAAAPTRKTKIRPDQHFVLRISLDGLRPEIWRSVRVPQDLTLGALHWVIQFAMGWQNSHLHQFVINGERYSEPRFEMNEYGDDIGDENTITLKEAFPRRRSNLDYEYDFGDDWGHTITLVDAVDPIEGEAVVACLGVERACPPEDCGGIWGYVEMLESLANPEDPERESYLEWIGGRFNPNAFNLVKVNRELRRLRLVPRQLIDIKPPRPWSDWESE
jgi:hypothetical protein